MRDIYIAGAFEAQHRLRHERNRIHWLGLGRVLSTWLDEEGGPTPGLEKKFANMAITSEQALAYATRDLEEIQSSNLLLLDTSDTNVRAGREVEFGIAIERGVEAWVIGPRRNVFHELAPRFETWDEVLDALTKEAA